MHWVKPPSMKQVAMNADSGQARLQHRGRQHDGLSVAAARRRDDVRRGGAEAGHPCAVLRQRHNLCGRTPNA